MSAALLLLTFIVILATHPLGVFIVNLYNAKIPRTQYRFYELTFPNDVRVDQVVDWWASVAATFGRSTLFRNPAQSIVVEMRADSTGIKHRVGLPWQHTELLEQLRAHLVGIHAEERELESLPTWTYAAEAGVHDSTRQLNVEKIEAQARRILSAATAELKRGDAVGVQLVISPIARGGNIIQDVAKLLSGPNKTSREVEADQKAKQSQHQFKTVLRVVAASDTPAHGKKLVYNIRDAYKALNTNASYIKRTRTKRSSVIQAFNHAAPPVTYPAQVSSLELTALSTFPVGGPMIPGLQLGRTRYLPPNETILRNGRRLGLSYQDRPVAISPVDACRHMYLIGPSGLGKSTFLTNMKQQDIERGDGVVSIETKDHAQFIRDLNTVPPERVKDALVWDFTDQDWPVGFNVLRGGNLASRVDGLTQVFARGDNDTYYRDIMYHGLHTLAHFPEMTIVDLVPFLSASLKGANPMLKAWRDGLIDRLPKTGEFYQYWKSFETFNDGERRQRIQPVLNRLWEVTNRRDLRNAFGQSESTIDFREVMRDNKLLFIYIPDSLGETTVSILTSLIFRELWDAVRDVEKNRPTHFYGDEAHRLRNVNIAEVLSLARSFKYGINLANQYRAQLPTETQAALTNVGTIAAFKLDGPDAQWMQSLMGKAVTADDFMALGPHEVIARIAINGGSSAPTWFKTLQPFEPHGLASEVRDRSRARHSTPSKKVDEAILRRRTPPTKTETKRERTFGTRVKEDSDE